MPGTFLMRAQLEEDARTTSNVMEPEIASTESVVEWLDPKRTQDTTTMKRLLQASALLQEPLNSGPPKATSAMENDTAL